MIFKSLFIHGFKSFVDKTLIEFPQGITAIVGPNGSGKSNIMDALRWVFGEQRASELRGSDMGDVVFAGSEKRRSSGFAEVGLTMANLPSEITSKWGTFSEITITRKIYRTGEREYYINGRRCRLKDIRDIFFDTNIGSRSISIIEQERVTKIVNSTPEELRYFLEEAAGVIRYKERRKEAETRLKQTHDNLARISDLLSVLSSDMQHLSSQVEQLKRYRALKEGKEKLEKTLICLTYAQHLKEKEAFASNIDKYNKTIAEIVGRNQTSIDKEAVLIRSQEELREKIRKIRGEYEEAKEKLAAAESDIRQYISNLETAEQQKAQLEEDIERSKERIGELNERIASVSDSIQDTFDLVSDFEEQVEECQEEIGSKRALLDRAQNDMKAHNRKYLELSQQLTDVTNAYNLKKAEAENRKAQMERLKREHSQFTAEIEEVGKSITDAEGCAADFQERKEAISEDIAEMRSTLIQRQESYDEAAEEYRELDISLKTALNQVEFLRKELENRISGGAEFLKEFNGRQYANSSMSEAVYLAFADLIVFESSVKEELLAKVKDMDISIRFVFDDELDKVKEQTVLEKIDGRLYRQGAVYRNIGTDDPSLALMKIQQNLSQEEQKVENLSSLALEARNKLSSMELEIEDMRDDLSEKSGELGRIELEHTQTLTKLNHLKEQHLRLGRNISVIDKEISMSKNEIGISTDELEKAERKVGQLSGLKEKADAERRELEERVESIEEVLDDLRQRHADASRELARYTERRNSLQAEKAQLNKDKQNAQSSLEGLERRLRDLAEVQTEEWRENLGKTQELKNELSKEVLRLSDLITTAEQSHSDQEDELAIMRSELGELNNTLRELDRKSAEYKARQEGVNVSLEAAYNEAMNRYGIDINETWREQIALAPSKQKIQESINSTTIEIEALGALNMAAEAEYEDKAAQYNEQSTQRKDIEDAVKNLTELIGEIDDSTVQLFSDTFKAVRQNFIEVFTRFFGSGTADLSLTDPDNMLTTGIELTLSPPGKKVSNKNLLSGGEKALAALTLLFALFLQKPTPFCFLDEVDAPLDDANANRFISMVRSLSDQTQFIIITHKHQTMAAADSLYGVTMQEGGVSTVLSVELK